MASQKLSQQIPVSIQFNPIFRYPDSQMPDSNTVTDPALKTLTQTQYKAIYLQLTKRIDSLEKKLDFLENKQPSVPKIKKKIRRKAKDVPKIYKCPFSNCGKQYGSQASLKNHKKIKHGIRLVRGAKSKIQSIKNEQK